MSARNLRLHEGDKTFATDLNLKRRLPMKKLYVTAAVLLMSTTGAYAAAVT